MSCTTAPRRRSSLRDSAWAASEVLQASDVLALDGEDTPGRSALCQAQGSMQLRLEGWERLTQSWPAGHRAALLPGDAAEAGRETGRHVASCARQTRQQLHRPMRPQSASMPGCEQVSADCPAGAQVCAGTACCLHLQDLQLSTSHVQGAVQPHLLSAPPADCRVHQHLLR